MGLVFKYHYSGDVALKRNFDKRTIKWEEVKKKRIILDYTSTFLEKNGFIGLVFPFSSISDFLSELRRPLIKDN